ncbi:hypothetical protein E2C01_078279 [Portunus trituberculatus]|uniref:Uncharacterized protein n=1 Tax=Portunus trituberculatus TaxID=210409 RepID=A0A5B7IPS8_PORTR|nr:hypothetical protein [Portunus trituberculatus]
MKEKEKKNAKEEDGKQNQNKWEEEKKEYRRKKKKGSSERKEDKKHQEEEEEEEEEEENRGRKEEGARKETVPSAIISRHAFPPLIYHTHTDKQLRKLMVLLSAPFLPPPARNCARVLPLLGYYDSPILPCTSPAIPKPPQASLPSQPSLTSFLQPVPPPAHFPSLPKRVSPPFLPLLNFSVQVLPQPTSHGVNKSKINQ